MLMVIYAGRLWLYFAAFSGESKYFLKEGGDINGMKGGGTVASWMPAWRLQSAMRRKGLDAMWRRCFLTSSSPATLYTPRFSSSLRIDLETGNHWLRNQRCLSFDLH